MVIVAMMLPIPSQLRALLRFIIQFLYGFVETKRDGCAFMRCSCCRRTLCLSLVPVHHSASSQWGMVDLQLERQKHPQPQHRGSMEQTSSFGAWLRLRRKALDLTQDELAR